MGNCHFVRQNSDARSFNLKSLRKLILKKGPFEEEPLIMKNIVAHGTIGGLEEKVVAMEKILYSVNEDDVLCQMEYTSALYYICGTMKDEYSMLFNCDPNAVVGCPMEREDVWMFGLAGLQLFQTSIANYRKCPYWIDIDPWYRRVDEQRTILEKLKELPMFAE